MDISSLNEQTDPILNEIDRLAPLVDCQADLQPDGKVVIKRKRIALTEALHPLVAAAWLRREWQVLSQKTAKAKLSKMRFG